MRASGDTPIPRHVAVIMDGNGRWARAKLLPRQAGHRAGVKTAKIIIKACVQHGVGVLTLFAFSSENWQRPKTEVGNLIELFVHSLENEIAELHKNNVLVRFIGERAAFANRLQIAMQQAEKLTESNQGMVLNIAVSYGGRWDIIQAVRKVSALVVSGDIQPDEINEDRISQSLSLSGLPDPDLFIRTGGEQRISNFLLWNLAYTELYFTNTLWPDFNTECLKSAIDWYAVRQRRFGRTSEQLSQEN
ncbi:MAG: isoprenyl transferase [Gammaproteobacteria bacterium]|nr:isoprenyl transferase [Gammaproteobacteria bacterium]